MPSQAYRSRRAGSVRFDPYYKVQWWDERALAWRDVQARYPDPDAGRDAYLPDRRCRLMEITMHGRRPLAS